MDIATSSFRRYGMMMTCGREPSIRKWGDRAYVVADEKGRPGLLSQTGGSSSSGDYSKRAG